VRACYCVCVCVCVCAGVPTGQGLHSAISRGSCSERYWAIISAASSPMLSVGSQVLNGSVKPRHWIERNEWADTSNTRKQSRNHVTGSSAASGRRGVTHVKQYRNKAMQQHSRQKQVQQCKNPASNTTARHPASETDNGADTQLPRRAMHRHGHRHSASNTDNSYRHSAKKSGQYRHSAINACNSADTQPATCTRDQQAPTLITTCTRVHRHPP
jgi:hypothetical protein